MVSAVVLAYNRCEEVLITIGKLKEYNREQDFDLEIVVVDNGSTDDTTAQIKARHPDINLITKVKNNGIAGWNDGFKAARYPYFLVLDDDSHIESGLREAVEYMKENPDTGILALNITGGNYMTTDWEDKKEAIGFIGCGAIISRKVFETVGGYADWLLIYGHEWEYGIRVIDAGFKIKYFKKSAVVHRTSATNRSSKRLRMYSTRNEMGIVYKYFSTNRFKYLRRVWINSMKIIAKEGFMAAYYCFLGGLMFLQLKPKLQYTPVSVQTQQYFLNIFWSTQPSFDFVRKAVNKLVGYFTNK